MSSRMQITEYETPPELFAHLARVFGENEHDGTRWVEFTHDGVRLTFFAPTPTPVEPDELAVADAFTPPDPFSRKV